MRIVLTTTLLVAVLAIGIVGINNSFAQNDTMSMGNSSVMNATLPMTIIGNNGTSNSTNLPSNFS